MDSASKKVAINWVDLPQELLQTISVCHGDPREIVRFRSVCQSWRSAAPLPNKLSPIFPIRSSFMDDNKLYKTYDDINACGVYLVRPRSDPSKACIVSLHEPVAGKLVLRHAISYNEITNSEGAGLELDPDWIASTQTLIAKFYAHNRPCRECKDGVIFSEKLVFGSEPGSNQLVGLCTHVFFNPFGFRLALCCGVSSVRMYSRAEHMIVDYVRFNGDIFAVDRAGRIHVLNRANLQLVQVTERLAGEDSWGRAWFVVSNGDLYAVWINMKGPHQVYRLEVVAWGLSATLVENLGDMVFFITHKCSFAISGGLLPHPWREGNCVLFPDFRFSICGNCESRDMYKHMVFRLGSSTLEEFWGEKDGSYSDLFCPPNSLVVKEEVDRTNPIPRIVPDGPSSPLTPL